MTVTNWLTPKEVADLLRYTDPTAVYDLIRAGELEAVNRSSGKRARYLVDPESVQRFLRRRMVRVPAATSAPSTLPPGMKRYV